MVKRSIAALLVCISFNAVSQDTLRLNPVTVTASLVPTQAMQTGRNITVVQSDQIRNLPVNSVDELLRYLPGLEVQSRGPMGTQSDLSIRGCTYQQVLVILDGIRLNDPLTGHFSAYVPVAPGQIERVEILKGAASAIYGTDAVGGVVNIVTKAFANEGLKPSRSLQAQTMLGEYGLFNNAVGGCFTEGPTVVDGGMLSNEASGQQLHGERGFFKLHTATVGVSQLLNDWQLSARASYDDRDFAAQNFYTPYSFDMATERVTSYWNQLRLAYRHGNDAVELHAGYKRTHDRYEFLPGFPANDNTMDLWQTLLTYNRKVSDNANVTVGGNWLQRGISSNDRGNHTVAEVAGFALLDQLVAQRFHLNPALRYEWNERGGAELVPQLNLSYSNERLQLRGGIGKTTREPDFTERFNNFNKPIVIKGSLGNPDLHAERSLAYEAGADYLPGTGLKLSATVFQRRYDKLIDWVTTPYSDMPYKQNLVDTGIYALATNIATVTTTGAELDVQCKHALTNDLKLWLDAGFTWTHNEGNANTPSFYLTSQASYLANASASLTSSWFTLSVNGLYKQREPQQATGIDAVVTENYFVMNARAEAFVIKNTLAATAQVDNVFDRKYSDLLGAQMPRRWLMGGLRMQL